MKEKIKFQILSNYIRNNGKIVDKAVMGVLLKENPDLKKDIKNLMSEIKEEIKIIESLSEKEILNLVKKEKIEISKKEKSNEKELIKVPGLIKGKVKTRMAPEPSKVNHIGHALSFLINYKYAKDYDGISVLRFEDTNPDNATSEFVESMKDDLLNYIGLKPDEIIIVSDHMEKYYEMAKQLIEKGHAYMDFSKQEELKKQREKLLPSIFRDKSVKENLSDWNTFISGKFNEGECILRLKIKPDHKNEVMRDPVLFRMMKKTHWKHSNKYCVWPLYDFENAIEDGLMGITHVFRSNEFGNKRIELQDHIRSLFNLKNPLVIQYGRFNIKGGVSKGREIKEMIDSGDYSGWDDPRLITLKALKRRGIQKEVYEKLLIEIGLSPTQTNIDFRTLSSINRQILDPISPKYFYVDNSIEIEIKNAPNLEIKFDTFPKKNDKSRIVNTKNKFLIAKNDLDNFKDGDVVRLIDTLNFKIVNIKKKIFEFHSIDFVSFQKEKNKSNKIHFVVKTESIKVKIINEDNTQTEGYLENSASKLKEGDIIQAERFGFIKLEKKNKTFYQFIFCHK
ncbi:glutamate--tRNA ligase [Candidatus Woesearchaeota archaeon]|jgi:glutamyl-tRNA synthetase|nr:glutamate--tRNA ligase [Candidatus Woesearchaeota archaeon]MBT4388001.1 glutamate--tRNA ligase [Candidatus Woesearchaeota archaeon]MBT4595345.1 glutamate--tRNA ligase [Candidatus Woesearchaeota archaeon]MBT5741250.1 glutamate--tRNA ligase [Candidatus Woesearchaeota archaeon]MBT6505854.1 glutamate--tRNA ligase [Candidatus Woesearchaeota archaeon]